MIDIDFRAYLIAQSELLSLLPNADEAGIVEQNKIDQAAPGRRIWYQRRSHEQALGQSGVALLAETTFDLECMSLDIDEAQEMAAVVKGLLHGYKGAMGSSKALMVEVFDHDDDYQPRGADVDEGLHVASLAVRITH